MSNHEAPGPPMNQFPPLGASTGKESFFSLVHGNELLPSHGAPN
jgi:hypothetical protein